MEQKKLTFQDILKECINNPEGEIAMMELNEENRDKLNKAIDVVNALEKNANDLRQYYINHPEKSAEEGAEEWFEGKYSAIRKKRKIK